MGISREPGAAVSSAPLKTATGLSETTREPVKSARFLIWVLSSRAKVSVSMLMTSKGPMVKSTLSPGWIVGIGGLLVALAWVREVGLIVTFVLGWDPTTVMYARLMILGSPGKSRSTGCPAPQPRTR